MIVFLGNSGDIKGAPTYIAVIYAILLTAGAALSWTFIWFILMPFGITQFGIMDWLLKGLMFYFIIFGIPIICAICKDKKKLKK